MADTVILPPLNPRGVYDSTVIYNPNDQVTYFGVPYYCRIGTVFGQPITPGSDPNTWQLITIPGDKGDKGDKGDIGEQGPRGRPGVAGASGAGYRPRGIWDAGTAYFAGDSVIAPNGAGTPAAVWFAVADNVNVAPGSNPAIWGLGVKGDTGDVTQAALDAEAAALASQQAAHTSETNAGQSATAALASKNAAGLSEGHAADSATAAGQSATAALASKNAAGLSEGHAADSATAAATSKGAAADSATAAGQSATAALASKNAAGTSETNAGNSAAAAAASAAAAAGLNFGVPVSTAAAAVALDQTYIGKNVKFTGAGPSAFTSLTAAQLAAGRALMITNDGTATITLAAQGSDKFNYGSNAVTSLTVLSGEWLILHGTGVANTIDVAAGSVMLAVTSRVRINQTADDGTSALQVGGRGAFTSGVGLGLAVPVLPNDAAPKIYVDTAVAYLSGRNKVRNGSIRVSQRASAASATGASNVRGGPDGFLCTNSNAGGTVTQFISQVLFKGRTVPVIVHRADTVLGDLSGTKYWGGIYQAIEGRDVAEGNGQPISLGFIFYATVAGFYSVEISYTTSDGSNYYYVENFNYTTAQAAQYVSVTTPPVQTTKPIVATNAAGISFRIGAQNSATLQCPAASLKTWGTTSYICGAGTTSWGTTANNLIAAGEVQLEFGPPTPFERISYDQDLARCQRYFCKTFPDGTYPAQGVSAAGALFLLGGNPSSAQYNGSYWAFQRTMRVSPALVFYEPIASANPGAWYDQANNNASSPGAIAIGDRGATVAIASASSVVIGASTAWYIHATADADL